MTIVLITHDQDVADGGGPAGPRARRADRAVNVVELIRLALSRLGASRLRAVLTMLGVIIGVASVVALVAVGQGATNGITSSSRTWAPTCSRSTRGRASRAARAARRARRRRSRSEDATAIGQIDGVAAVAPQVQTQALVVAGTLNTTTTVIGTSAAYATVRNYEVWQGSFLTDASLDAGMRAAVLGATTADDLGLDATLDRPHHHHRRAALPPRGHPPGQGQRRAPSARTTRSSSP